MEEKKKKGKKAAKPAIYLTDEVTCLAPLKHVAWSCDTVMENHLELRTNDGLHQITCRWRVLKGSFFTRSEMELCVGRKHRAGLWMGLGKGKKDKIQHSGSSVKTAGRGRAAREERAKLSKRDSIPDEHLFKWMN